jgi:hypothetical protein
LHLRVSNCYSDPEFSDPFFLGQKPDTHQMLIFTLTPISPCLLRCVAVNTASNDE